MIREERALIETIRKRQRKLIEHKFRGVLLLRTAIRLKMDEKKTRNHLFSVI